MTTDNHCHPKPNFRADKFRSNNPSAQMRLAKIFALNTLQEAIRELKRTGFECDEIVSVIPELFEQA